MAGDYHIRRALAELDAVGATAYEIDAVRISRARDLLRLALSESVAAATRTGERRRNARRHRHDME